MRCLLISKKKIRILLLFLLLAALVLGVIPAKADKGTRLLPIYGVNCEEKVAALTFDCAWENSDTDILLRLLEQNGVPATFFVTGDWCERYPEDVKKFAAAGHAIENHSYAHPHGTKIGKEELLADTGRCDEIIASLVGKRPRLYRAPYGEYGNAMLQALEESGHKVIQWDVDSVDWSGKSAEEMVESVCGKVRPGSILLFHNDTENTPAALAQILPRLRGEGYRFLLVEDMILWDGYTLDHEGRQVKIVAS